MVSEAQATRFVSLGLSTGQQQSVCGSPNLYTAREYLSKIAILLCHMKLEIEVSTKRETMVITFIYIKNLLPICYVDYFRGI